MVFGEGAARNVNDWISLQLLHDVSDALATAFNYRAPYTLLSGGASWQVWSSISPWVASISITSSSSSYERVVFGVPAYAAPIPFYSAFCADGTVGLGWYSNWKIFGFVVASSDISAKLLIVVSLADPLLDDSFVIALSTTRGSTVSNAHEMFRVVGNFLSTVKPATGAMVALTWAFSSTLDAVSFIGSGVDARRDLLGLLLQQRRLVYLETFWRRAQKRAT